MKARLTLTDSQFEALDTETRRSMIYQLMFIDTPRYQYCIGAYDRCWTIVRYEWNCTKEKIDKETLTIVDTWS